jgi:hypothetical protein
MNALLVASILAASPAAPATSTLEQGLKREVTLLVGEQEGLRRELERLQTLRASRVAGLQRELAILEAKAIEVAGREATARTALGALTPASPPPPPADAAPAMREALRLLKVTTSSPSSPSSSAGPLVDQLGTAIARLDALTRPQRVETGFFSADGTWRQGVVVSVGGLGVAATNEADVAGPLLSSGDGTLQLSAVMPMGAADAARQIVAGEPTALWPIALGGPEEPGASTAVAGVGVVERLTRLGIAGAFIVAALLLVVAVALGQLLTAVRRHRAVTAVAGRMVGLVASGETVAAAALARTVGGAAGRFLVAVVAVVGRGTPEDEVAALSAEASAALQRGGLIARGLFAIVAAIAVVVSAGTLDGILAAAAPEEGLAHGLATGVLPLVLLAIAAVPFIAAIVVADLVVARTRELLEVTALRLLDAATRGT